MFHLTTRRVASRVVVAVIVLGGATAGAQSPSPGRSREVAVTFDDLPLVSRLYRDVASQERITERLLATIRAYDIPAIGFVNEGKLAPDGRRDERRVALLRRWVDAGLELGNHTYGHLDLHATPLVRYKEEILRGDAVTRRLLAAAGRRPRYFRHPYLRTGRDRATRDDLEGFLAEHGYRVAPVTIDNSDYVFAAAYEQALAGGDSSAARRVADAYVDYMEQVVRYYEQQSDSLFGRQIRQVLLVHANALNADHFGAVARMLLRRGYRFVTLDRALADEAYASRDEYTGPAGITWLHRWALTQGKRGAFFAGEPAVHDTVLAVACAMRPGGPEPPDFCRARR